MWLCLATAFILLLVLRQYGITLCIANQDHRQSFTVVTVQVFLIFLPTQQHGHLSLSISHPGNCHLPSGIIPSRLHSAGSGIFPINPTTQEKYEKKEDQLEFSASFITSCIDFDQPLLRYDRIWESIWIFIASLHHFWPLDCCQKSIITLIIRLSYFGPSTIHTCQHRARRIRTTHLSKSS